MDPILLIITFKGIATLMAMMIGFLIARYGFHLYKDGAGAGKDSTAITAGSIKIKAQSVGSVVMATAFLWAWAGVLVSPSLKKEGEDWNVSLGGQAVEVIYPTRGPIMAGNGRIITQNEQDPAELKIQLASALSDPKNRSFFNSSDHTKEAETIDPKLIKALKTESGDYILTAPINTKKGTTQVAFIPERKGTELGFRAAGISLPPESKEHIENNKSANN